MRHNRRDFLIQSGLAVGGTALLSSCGGKVFGQYRFFTDAEALTVIALCEQIVPADKDPGATEAGVIGFIDNQLTRHYSGFQQLYREGIAALNGCCKQTHGSRFEAMAFEDQLAFLKKIEKGKIADERWKPADQREFFRAVLTHTMQGFYGSPRHGGNKNYASYTMMGIEYPLVVGQNRYRGIDP